MRPAAMIVAAHDLQTALSICAPGSIYGTIFGNDTLVWSEWRNGHCSRDVGRLG